MKEKVRCKACGYVMEKDALGEVCPACGVKKEMFEPWEDKVGAFRNLILERHIHPIIVHVPQAVAALTLIIGAVWPLLPVDLQTQYLWPTFVVLGWILPVSVIGAFVSGIADAKVRFRKISTPALIRKQIFGSVFFLASVVMLILLTQTTSRFDDLVFWLSFLATNLVAMGAATVLGLIGEPLMHAAMPGDKILLKKKKKAAPKVPATPKTD